MIKILKQILRRLHGSGSYNKGVRIITFGEVTSKGEFNTPLFNKLNLVDDNNPEQFPVPIIVSLTNKADNFNIDDNQKIALDITYINQNDETKTGKVYIPCYAFNNSDYKVYMEDSDDLVKEVTGVSFRKDVIETFLSGEEMEESYGQTLTEVLKSPWEDETWKFEQIDQGSYFTIQGTDKTEVYDLINKYFYPNEEYNTNPDITQYKKFRRNPFYIEEFNKYHQIALKLRVSQDTMTLYAYIMSPTNKQIALKAWTADPLTYDILKSLESSGGIQVGELLTAGEWIEDTLCVENIQNEEAREGIGVNSFDFNLITFNFATIPFEPIKYSTFTDTSGSSCSTSEIDYDGKLDVIRLQDNNASAQAEITNSNLTPVSFPYISFNFQSDDVTKLTYVLLTDEIGSGAGLVIRLDDGYFTVTLSTGDVNIYPLSNDTWFQIVLKIKSATLIDIWVNEVYQGEFTHAGDLESFSKLFIRTRANESGYNGYIHRIYIGDSLEKAFNNSLSWDFEYIRLEQCTGNINDKLEIIGMFGNIAKLQSVFSLQLSEVQDEMKIASRQNFPLQTYKSGIEALFNDYQIPYNSCYSIEVQHALLQLFGQYAIPTKTQINESLTFIYSIIDPEGEVNAYGDFDNPYTLVVEIYDSDLQFTIDSIDLITIFVERYRPIPAKTDIKIIFENEDITEEITATEELTLVVKSNQTYMSQTTLMAPATIMGAGSISEIELPADYP